LFIKGVTVNLGNLTWYRLSELPDSPYRLGRHVRHDARSLNYAQGVLPKAAIKTVAWQRRIPILDQGDLGSCTGNALTGLLGTDSATRTASPTLTVKADPYGIFTAGTYTLNEAFAVKGYSLNTHEDTYDGDYPPTDTGSDTLSCGKSAVDLGVATGYTHAFSIDALKSGLQSGPALWGTVWLNSMFNTDSKGNLKVTKSSGVAGGHELCITGYDATAKVFTVANSWGATWGDEGYCYVKEADMTWLLSQDGDAAFVAVTVDSPTPVPTPPPTPTPTPTVDVNTLLAYRSLQLWAKQNGVV
jgi:hypothetical protein